jgi:hypothetical protein
LHQLEKPEVTGSAAIKLFSDIQVNWYKLFAGDGDALYLAVMSIDNAHKMYCNLSG